MPLEFAVKVVPGLSTSVESGEITGGDVGRENCDGFAIDDEVESTLCRCECLATEDEVSGWVCGESLRA